MSLTEELRRNLGADVVQQLRTRGNKIGATLGSIHGEILLLTRLIEDLQELFLAESRQIHYGGSRANWAFCSAMLIIR